MPGTFFSMRGRTKIILFYLLLSLSVPLALAFTDIISGLASPAEFFAAIPGPALIYLIVSAVLAGTGLVLLINKVGATSNMTLLLILRYGSLIWGSFNNLIFSLIFHNGTVYGASSVVQIITGMYAWAVGLFFGILMIVGVSADLEKLIPEEKLLHERIRGGLTSKLFLSVTIVVAAFLTGAIGVSLMPIAAGLTILQAIPRVLTIAIPFLLLTLLLVFFLSRIMTRPLESSKDKITALGNKDLTQVLEVPSRDELGHLFIFLNQFIAGLKEVLVDASENSEENTRQSQELDSLVESEKDLLARIDKEMNQISGLIADLNLNTNRTVEETQSMNDVASKLRASVIAQTESVEETSSAAEEMLASAKNIASIARDRKKAAGSLNSVTIDSQQNLNESLESMEEVMKQLNSLSDINKVINTVAAQTNLLAMNAAIEAAHAGDAGRGFSVVAEEIRNLAESTAENAKNSAAFVKGMIKSIEESNSGMETVQSSFTQVKSVGDDLIAGLEEIAAASAEMEDSSNLIVNRMQNLKDQSSTVTAGTSEIKKSIEAVDSASHKSSTSSESVQQETAEILEHVKSLQEMASAIGESSTRLHNGALRLKEQFNQFTLQ